MIEVTFRDRLDPNCLPAAFGECEWPQGLDVEDAIGSSHKVMIAREIGDLPIRSGEYFMLLQPFGKLVRVDLLLEKHERDIKQGLVTILGLVRV
jgi:hypothetical protein